VVQKLKGLIISHGHADAVPCVQIDTSKQAGNAQAHTIARMHAVHLTPLASSDRSSYMAAGRHRTREMIEMMVHGIGMRALNPRTKRSPGRDVTDRSPCMD
jgi:hypothetical protein